MNARSFLALVSLTLVVAACGAPQTSAVKEAWNQINDPLRLSGDYERTLADLPTTGTLDVEPWSDTYWPSHKGGIAARWNSETSVDNFAYQTPSKNKVKNMSLAKRAQLSPAEKFDIFVGNYNYPTIARERARTSPDDQTWEGICHGWAPAAINFAEPKSVVVKGKFNIQVPFGAADVKALLSYLQGQVSYAPSRMLGARCNIDLSEQPDLSDRSECRDTNAGAFHVALANQIGVMKEGFVADVTRDLQVWNQPIHGFDSEILSEQAPSAGAAEGTVKEVIVRTKMHYIVEIDAVWDAVVGTEDNWAQTAVYDYRLELNEAGQIIGGEWLSEARPDFLWTQETPNFTGYFKKLKQVYDAALASEGIENPVQ
jgi:hypothetical protein